MSNTALFSGSGSVDLAYVREVIERATNSSPFLSIDWETYTTIQRWCNYPDKRVIVESVIASRLELPPPASHKAVVLAQVLPNPSLVPLIESLTPLAAPKDDAGQHGYITAIAASLVERATAEKKKVEEEEEKRKWGLWGEKYGDSQAGWPEMPKKEWPEWGCYGMRWVGADEWWTVKPETEKQAEG